MQPPGAGSSPRGPASGVRIAWGSDAIAELLRSLQLPFVALNPGASYRGLHDSIVNLLGNERPQIVLCLHEEHAVAIAHGYAKVTGRPLAVALHANVGLMHATMALFNAFCDRSRCSSWGRPDRLTPAPAGRGSTGSTRLPTRRR
ncbi:MAG: thiamine pyrophosphate-binding protein [Solirubrobacteraceae bacterium]